MYKDKNQIKTNKPDKNYNIKTFEFIDEAIHPLYFSKLADIIIKRNIDIKYVCCSRIESKYYTKELCEKLYASLHIYLQFLDSQMKQKKMA